MSTVSIETLIVSSPAFKHEGEIPQKYTCEGEEINPPLELSEIPHGTQSLALIMEDPDAPNGTFYHWIVWNIPPDEHKIPEHSNPGISGMNSGGKTGYHGPCPPDGSHRYYFHVYALDKELNIAAGESKASLTEEMEKHILAKGSLMGRYEKKGKSV